MRFTEKATGIKNYRNRQKCEKVVFLEIVSDMRLSQIGPEGQKLMVFSGFLAVFIKVVS
jgi:hypothetical protein